MAAEETFSCAAGVEVLYFIENLQWALEELYRVLKPDGRFVLITAAQPKSRLSRWVFSPWLRYLRFHSNDALASMLKQAGFQTLVVERVNKSEHTAFAHQLVCVAKGAD